MNMNRCFIIYSNTKVTCFLLFSLMSFTRLQKQFLRLNNRLLISIMGLFFINMVSAQSDVHLIVSDRAMVSGASHLPFWFWANQDGKIDMETSFLNLTEVSTEGTTVFSKKRETKLSYGASLLSGLEDDSYLQLNRLFAAIDYRGWKLSAGMYYDQERFEGLSATNGTLARSRNARPYPRIGFGTPEFKKLPFFQHWLKFKAEYEEGLLDDRRYVTDTHLHHKALYFQVTPGADWKIEAGMEHFVMWGGTSPDGRIGKMPTDFGSYLRYIRGASGDDVFPGTDQLNVAGNQYGTYQLKVKKEWERGNVAFYLSHPFDDLSGMNLRNYPDNLIGIHGHINNSKAFLTDFLYEITNTRQQSVQDSLYYWNESKGEWARKEVDNYFNHGVYRSGATYRKMSIASPLFAPVIINDGISTGFGSTRFLSHHFGLKGMAGTDLYWKSFITITNYLGHYYTPYEPSKNQVSALLQFDYKSRKLPFNMMLAFAFDSGKLYENAFGVQLGISKQW